MIVVVDYGMGNLGSIANMLKKIGAAATVSGDRAIITGASRLILPGVGAFDNGMRRLHELDLVGPLSEMVLARKIPLLGICLGFQLLGSSSEEGQAAGLGWLPARTIRFSSENNLRVPHMGWNSVRATEHDPLLIGLEQGARFYFAHSYHVQCEAGAKVLLKCNYGGDFDAAARRENILGVQFHPEKSHRFGIRLFENFVKL